MVFLGLIVGFIDGMIGLGDAGAFLAPIVYGFRFGFLELNAEKFNVKNNVKLLSIFNAIGYFLTTLLIWVMYWMLGIPLGTEFVRQMWFIFGLVGSLVALPSTALGYKVAQKILDRLKL